MPRYSLEYYLRNGIRTVSVIGMMLGPVKPISASSSNPEQDRNSMPVPGCTIGPVSQFGQPIEPYINPAWPNYYEPNGIHANTNNKEYPSVDLPNVVAAGNIFPEGGIVRWIGSDPSGTGKNGLVIEGMGACVGIFSTVYHLDQLPPKQTGSIVTGSEILGNASCAGFEADCDKNGSQIPRHLHFGVAFSDPNRIPASLKSYETDVSPAIFGTDKVYFVQVLDLVKWSVENGHYLNMYQTVWDAVHDAGGTDQDAVFVYGTTISESGGTYCPQDGFWNQKYSKDGIGGFPDNLCISSVGAIGTHQFMRGTWDIQMANDPELTKESIYDPYQSAQEAYHMLKRIGVLDALATGNEQLAKQLFSATAPLNDKTRKYAVNDGHGKLILQGWNLGDKGYDQATKILAFTKGLNGITPAPVGAVNPKGNSIPPILDGTYWREIVRLAEATQNNARERINILRIILNQYPIPSALGLVSLVSALTFAFNKTRKERKDTERFRILLALKLQKTRKSRKNKRVIF
ncbi:hypothetical protein HYU91_04585 [Candidatus Collierbacteria bacterium]|nr:hypothetical protein [Candidatus Collierbacteria bacterium]